MTRNPMLRAPAAHTPDPSDTEPVPTFAGPPIAEGPREPIGPPVPTAAPQPVPEYVTDPKLAAQVNTYEQQLAAEGDSHHEPNPEPATTMTGDEILVQSILDAGVAELVTASTSDDVIEALVLAAELGHGGPIPGLQEALTSIRDGEREDAQRWENLVEELASLSSTAPIHDLVRVAEAARGGPIPGLLATLRERTTER